jgi:hypothetical protein
MIIGGYLNTSAQTVATATTAAGMQFYNGGFYWYGNSGLTIGSVYTNTQNMFLTVGGNLIIGSGADAGYKLDVSGTGRFSGALSGTSATFSSSVTATNLSAYGATNTNVIIAGVNSATNNPRFFVQCEESTNTIKLIGGSSTGSDNMSLGVGGNTNIYIKAGGNVLIGTTTTCKGLLRVAGDAEVCKTLFFNGGDGNGGAIANALAVASCATPVYNLRTMFCFNNMSNYGAYLFIHTGYNTVTTKNTTITGIVNNGANQTISILATTADAGATAPTAYSTSNWCIAFCWPNAANANTQFIMLAG